jgi:hypothetical protein
MTANHDLERRVADFYAAEADRTPNRVLEQALARIDHTRQRRELSLVPWRFPPMNIYAKLAVAAAVVLAVGGIGLALLGPRPGPSIGGPNPSTSPVPSASIAPSSSQELAPPPLTGRYTSALHGTSISYPEGWATAPATDPEPPAERGFLSPDGDFLYDPELRDHLFLVLGSEPLDGQAGQAWATAAFDADDDCVSEPRSISVDGAPALLCGTWAMTWLGDRGYLIRLLVSPDEPKDRLIYDQAWFEDVLETVQLPEAN